MKPATYLTNKKLLLSLGVVAGGVFLVFVGTWIHEAIMNGAEQKARMYQTAVQAANDRELNYSIDTKQNYVFAPITVKQVDTVKFPEMNKEFPAVEKTEETYTKHSREECNYDEDGNATNCRTEYYYTWDQTGHWSLSGNEVTMAGRKYPMSLFALSMSSVDAKDIIAGQTEHYVYVESKGLFGFDVDIFNEADEGDKRTEYSVMNLPQSGTAFLKLSEGVQAGEGGKIHLDSRNAKTIVTEAQNSAHTQSVVFTIFWAILVLGELLGLGYWVWLYEKY